MLVISLCDYRKKKREREERIHALYLLGFGLRLLKSMRKQVGAGKPISPRLILKFFENCEELGMPVDPVLQRWVEKVHRGEPVYLARNKVHP